MSSLIIGAVTFFICLCGLVAGQRPGTCLASKTELFSSILIGIGIEIWITGVLM
ncbi:MAG: manganese efflux pump [Oxalobacter sp.]